MFIIPGFLIGWATFPGVIIHEFAHKKSCDWRGIAVRDVDYFSWSGRGYVTHRSPRRFSDTLAISAFGQTYFHLSASSVVSMVTWSGSGISASVSTGLLER